MAGYGFTRENGGSRYANLSGYSNPGEKVECDIELDDGGTTLVGLWNPR